MAIDLKHYSVEGVPESRFHELAWYVQRSQNSLRTDAGRDEPKIYRVTDSFDGLGYQGERARKRSQSSPGLVGLAWSHFGLIWVKPDRNPLETEKTLLHEISHCFVHSQSHGPKWRRVYCVALAHWLRSLGKSEETIRVQIKNTVARYRHYRMYTPQGEFNSYVEYYRKVQSEADKLYRASKKG